MSACSKYRSFAAWFLGFLAVFMVGLPSSLLAAAALTNTLTFRLQDFLQQDYTGRVITIQSKSTPRTNPPYIAVNTFLTRTSSAAGVAILTNILDGTYGISIGGAGLPGSQQPTRFDIYVPTNNPATLDASTLLTTNIEANATVAWTRAQADGRFVRVTNGNATNLSAHATNFNFTIGNTNIGTLLTRGTNGLPYWQTNAGGAGSGSVTSVAFTNGNGGLVAFGPAVTSSGILTAQVSTALLSLHNSNAASLSNLSIPATNTLTVNMGGIDANGQRGNPGRPWLTPTTAVSNALPGDLVIIQPGTYSNTNRLTLASNGVHWNFMPGARYISGGTNAMPPFSDMTNWLAFGGEVAVTSIVSGAGFFTYTNGLLSDVTGNYGVIAVTHPLTRLSIEADHIQSTGQVAGIWQTNGWLSVRANRMTSYDYDPVWWFGGELHGDFKNLQADGAGISAGGAIYVRSDIADNSSPNMFIRADFVYGSNGTAVFKSDSSIGAQNFRSWLNIPLGVSQAAEAVRNDVGYLYLDSQKIQSTNTGTSAGSGTLRFGAEGKAWLRIAKVTSGGNLAAYFTGGTNFVETQEFEDSSNTVGFIQSTGGSNIVRFLSARATGQQATKGINHSGGSLRVVDGLFDLTAAIATNAWGVHLISSNLTLQNVEFRLNATTFAAYASSAQTLNLRGIVTANRPLAPLVTIAGGVFHNTTSNEFLFPGFLRFQSNNDAMATVTNLHANLAMIANSNLGRAWTGDASIPLLTATTSITLSNGADLRFQTGPWIGFFGLFNFEFAAPWTSNALYYQPPTGQDSNYFAVSSNGAVTAKAYYTNDGDGTPVLLNTGGAAPAGVTNGLFLGGTFQGGILTNIWTNDNATFLGNGTATLSNFIFRGGVFSNSLGYNITNTSTATNIAALTVEGLVNSSTNIVFRVTSNGVQNTHIRADGRLRIVSPHISGNPMLSLNDEDTGFSHTSGYLIAYINGTDEGGFNPSYFWIAAGNALQFGGASGTTWLIERGAGTLSLTNNGGEAARLALGSFTNAPGRAVTNQSPYTLTTNATAINTAIINGNQRVHVNAIVELDATAARASARAMVSNSTVGWFEADIASAPTLAGARTNSLVFKVDPGATYYITNDANATVKMMRIWGE